jgi:hypothetical protein
MDSIEIFLVLKMSEPVQVKFEGQLMPKLQELKFIQNLMMVAPDENGNARLNFSCDIDNSDIDAVFALITVTGCLINEEFIHFNSQVSGIHDAYDVRASGGTIQDALLLIEGIKNASISSSGTLKMEIDKFDHQDHLIRQVLKHLAGLRNNQ